MNIHKIIADELKEQARRRTGHTVGKNYESHNPPHMTNLPNFDETSWNVSGEYREMDVEVNWSIRIASEGISVTTGYDLWRDFMFADPHLFDRIWRWIEIETPRLVACKARGLVTEPPEGDEDTWWECLAIVMQKKFGRVPARCLER